MGCQLDGGQHLQHHRRAGRADEPRGGGAEAVEGLVHVLVIAEAVEHRRHNQNDDDGGRHLPQGGDDGPGDARRREAHVGGHVDADGAGGGLRHRQHVHQIRVGVPAGGLADGLEEGQGRHAAAHGEEAGLEKLPEELQTGGNHAFFASRFFNKMPVRAEPTTNHTGESFKNTPPRRTTPKIAAVRLSTTDFFKSFSTALKISTQTQT